MSSKIHFIDFPVFKTPEFHLRREKCRGENQRKLLILLPSDEDTEVLLSYLTKILAAAELDLSNDALLLPVASEEQIHLSSFVRQEGIKTVLAFGIAPWRLSLHLQISAYEPITVGSVQILLAHALSKIYDERQRGGKEMAKALWRGLQALLL